MPAMTDVRSHNLASLSSVRSNEPSHDVTQCPGNKEYKNLTQFSGTNPNVKFKTWIAPLLNAAEFWKCGDACKLTQLRSHLTGQAHELFSTLTVEERRDWTKVHDKFTSSFAGIENEVASRNQFHMRNQKANENTAECAFAL